MNNRRLIADLLLVYAGRMATLILAAGIVTGAIGALVYLILRGMKAW